MRQRLTTTDVLTTVLFVWPGHKTSSNNVGTTMLGNVLWIFDLFGQAITLKLKMVGLEENPSLEVTDCVSTATLWG